MSNPKLHWEDDKEDRRLSLQLGEVEVGHLWSLDMRMRIGSTQVRMAGIKDVHIAEGHRLKGYASGGMHAAIESMKDGGYDMSLLFGIPGFYHRFGYAAAFPESSLTIKTSDLLRAENRFSSKRLLRKTDLPEMLRWYNRNNAGRTGSIVRSKTWKYGRPWPLGVIGVLDARGRFAGYLKYLKEDKGGGSPLDAVEVEARDGGMFGTLAAAMGRQARRRDVGEVRIWLPPDHPFGAYCAGLGCRLETRHSPDSNAMARIICLERLMKKLVPEFGRRLGGAGSARKGRFTLATDIGALGLEVQGRRVRMRSEKRGAPVIRIPQRALTQLVMGYRSVAEIAVDPEVKVPTRLVPIFTMLFPKGQPYMAYPDRF